MDITTFILGIEAQLIKGRRLREITPCTDHPTPSSAHAKAEDIGKWLSQSLPVPSDEEEGPLIGYKSETPSEKTNSRESIMDEARLIMRVSAALICLYGNGNSYHSSSIPQKLRTLDKLMLGLLWDLYRLQTRENVC